MPAIGSVHRESTNPVNFILIPRSWRFLVRRSLGNPLRDRRPGSRAALFAIMMIAIESSGSSLQGQETGKPGVEAGESGPSAFYQRKVQIPQRMPFPTVVMSEFFTNGVLVKDA